MFKLGLDFWVGWEIKENQGAKVGCAESCKRVSSGEESGVQQERAAISFGLDACWASEWVGSS